MRYCYKSRFDLADLYEDVLNQSCKVIEEGIDEKIPKILNLLPDKVQFDGFPIYLTDVESKGSFIKRIASDFDPTPNAAYITWILKLVKIGNIRGMEDRSKVHDSLKKFTELKNKPQFPAQYKDINRFKSFGDLAEVLDQFGDVKSKKETVRIAKEEGIELVDTDAEYKLYIVTKSEAGAKHFRNTQWCVKDPRYFDQYSPPYYYFTKNDEPYTLLHLDSDQCMDVQDRNKSLNSSEINMMETEEMTKYVVEHDNSSDSMSNYSERVGGGYYGIIDEFVEKQLTELIAQYDFKHYDLDSNNISEGYYIASGFITYNFTGLEEYFDDKNFIQIVKDSLNYIDKYPDYLSSDNFSDKGVSIDIEYDQQSDYDTKSKLEQLKSFLNQLDGDDDRYESDIENFEEHLTEKLLNDGYIPSGWATFKSKVLDNLITDKYRNTFQKAKTSKTRSNSYSVEFDIHWGNKDINDKLVSKFFKHLTASVKQIYWRNHDGVILYVSYQPEYDSELGIEDYMRDFKIFKSFNIHYDNYQDQINRFGKYLKNSVSGSEEIPLFTLRSRKSPPEQEYFQFRESKKHTFNSLCERIKLFENN